MRKPIIHTFDALTMYAPLILNGDEQGMAFGDVGSLLKFYEDNGFNGSIGHFSSPPDYEPFFGSCEVTGTRGTVCTFHFVEMRAAP